MSKISEIEISHLRHELRTPINHIIGYTEMLQEEAEDQGREDFVTELHFMWTAGQNLLRAVNEALGASGGDSGEISLPSLQKQIRKPLEQIISRTGDIERSADSCSQAGIIDDLQKIRLAAYNLLELVNHKTLTSALSQMELTGIFDDHAALAEAQSGDEASVIEESQRQIKSPFAAKVNTGFILVVEDNGISRDMLCRRVERQGHRIAQAENGRLALEMVAKHDFDLILLDVMMPEMDGYQALQRLKSDDSSRDIPVIMLSALGEMDSVVKCIELGAEDYLSKPFDPVLLKARIDAGLEKKRLRDQEVLNIQKIESMNAELEKRVEARVKELKQANKSLVVEVAQRKKLEEQLQEKMAEMAMADEIARIITSTLDIDQAYEEFALELKKLVSCDRMNINVIDNDRGNFVTKYLYGAGRSDYRIGEPRPLEGTQVERVLKTGKVLLREDIRKDPHFAADAEWNRQGLHTSITLPLTSKGKIIGTMGLRSRQNGAYGEKEQTILGRVAKQIAPAVENAQLFDDAIKEKDRATKTLAQLRALLDAVDAGILLLGSDDETVLWSNLKLAGFFGKENARPLFDAVVERQRIRELSRHCLADPEEDFDRTEQIIADRTYSGTQELEFIYPEPRSIQRFTTPVYDDSDESSEYLGRLWVYYDVTERRKLEQQLLQSQKMETVGRLAGGIAHDFNNLLTPIMGYAALSSMSLSNGHPSHGYLEEVRKAAERASNLAQQLLTFSKGQITQTKVTDLNELVLNMDDLLRPVIREDIELVTLPANDLARVKVDPGQIEQVLLNLVINARDAMPDGGKLTIETADAHLDNEYVQRYLSGNVGQYVMFSVSDNGTGISDEVKSHIFEPFFTTKEQGKGTGLGLSTCYGIVKQSNGHIDVSSDPGQGTIFRVYLPATDEFPDESDLATDDAYLPRGTETVLLVEDEPSVRSMLASILLNQGYTVLQASTGDEALRVAEENSSANISLLLTDVVMPNMGGIKLASEFSYDHPDAKVIFVSGYADQPILPENIAEPDFAIIRKPFMPGVLARKVREVLDR